MAMPRLLPEALSVWCSVMAGRVTCPVATLPLCQECGMHQEGGYVSAHTAAVLVIMVACCRSNVRCLHNI